MTREEERISFFYNNKMKPKVLLPSLKEKKRYLAFEVIAEKPVSFKEAKENIKMAMMQLTGELGLAKAGLMFMDDWKNNRGLVRVNNKSVNEVKASMALIKEINNQKAIMKSIGVSGILDKARKKYMEVD